MDSYSACAPGSHSRCCLWRRTAGRLPAHDLAHDRFRRLPQELLEVDRTVLEVGHAGRHHRPVCYAAHCGHSLSLKSDLPRFQILGNGRFPYLTGSSLTPALPTRSTHNTEIEKFCRKRSNVMPVFEEKGFSIPDSRDARQARATQKCQSNAACCQGHNFPATTLREQTLDERLQGLRAHCEIL